MDLLRRRPRSCSWGGRLLEMLSELGARDKKEESVREWEGVRKRVALTGQIA
jgi:hypothetical protein